MMVEQYGASSRTAPIESLWQIGMVERHGGIVSEVIVTCRIQNPNMSRAVWVRTKQVGARRDGAGNSEAAQIGPIKGERPGRRGRTIRDKTSLGDQTTICPRLQD